MKKLIVCLLSISMIISYITPTFAENTNYNIQNLEYAVDVLKGLNIYNKSSSTSSKIKRIEFVTNLCEIIDSNKIFSFEEENVKHITDVAEPDKKYVDLALKKGLIKAPIDGKFYPDADVDLDFASYAFVAMTGYFQELQTGNYQNKAHSLGITKGVSSYNSLSHADFVIMLYNMLESSYLEQVSYGSESKFVVSDDTVLEHFFGLSKFNARLVANSYTDLTNTISLSDNHIALQRAYDNVIETYECNYTYDDELLGRNVTVYYNEKEEFVVYMALNKKDECLAEISGADFVDFDMNERKMYYQKLKSGSRWEETYKTVDVKIPVNVDIIYNGQFTLDHNFVYDILEGKSTLNIGNVSVFDIDGDSKADLMKVDAYRDILVESVSESEKTISDAITGKRVVLDEDELDGIVRIKDASGEDIKLSAIKRNDVVSMYSGNGDNPLIKIVVSNITKNEHLVSRYERDGREYVETENTHYLISEDLIASGKSFSLGKEYKLYLDYLGCIVKVSETDSIYNNIGSVVKVGALEEAFSPKLELEIYTANGEFETYNTAEKLYIDGKRIEIDDNTWTYVDKDGNTVKIVNQLRKGIIQFNVNSKNEINKIYFPSVKGQDGVITYSSGMANPEGAFSDPEKYTLRYKNNGRYFIPNTSGAAIMNFVALGTDAKIMTVPSDNITSNRKNYYKLTDTLKNDTVSAVVGYTFSKGSIKSDLVVLVSEGSASVENSAYYVVKKVYHTINSDECVALAIECMNSNGNVTTFIGADEKIPQCDPESGDIIGQEVSIAVGDVIKVALNNVGEVAAIGKAYDSVTSSGTLLNPTYWYASKRFVYGSVYDVEDNVISYVVGKQIVNDDVSADMHVVGLNKTNAIIVKPGGRNGYIVEYGNLAEVVGYKEDSTMYSSMVLAGAYGETSLIVFYAKE